MGDTLSVFKRKSKPKFKIPQQTEPKVQKMKVTSKRRDSTKARRKGSDPHRPKRTVYEDTINIDRSGSIAPEEYRTASIDAIRAVKKRKYVVWGVFSGVLVTALVALVVWFALMFFFKIESIECEGITVYDTDEIIEASGIKVGGDMYNIGADRIEKHLAERYPYLMNIRVERRLPDGIVIKAEEDTAAYYTELGGKYYVLSSELRVLENMRDEEELSQREGLLHIILPEVSEAIVGQKVRYFREKNEEYVLETVHSLMELPDSHKINLVDMSDRFELKFTYDNRITVELGAAEDIPAKVRFALAMIDEFSDFATGTVSARSVERGYAKIVDPQSAVKEE